MCLANIKIKTLSGTHSEHRVIVEEVQLVVGKERLYAVQVSLIVPRRRLARRDLEIRKGLLVTLYCQAGV